MDKEWNDKMNAPLGFFEEMAGRDLTQVWFMIENAQSGACSKERFVGLLRLARLGLWAEKHGIPTLKMWEGANPAKLALAALPKGAQA